MKHLFVILGILMVIWTTTTIHLPAQTEGEKGNTEETVIREQDNGTEKIKKEIDKIKEKLKEMTGGIAFSGFFDVTASGYKDNPKKKQKSFESPSITLP